MSVLTLALLGQLAASCPTASMVPFDRVTATAEVESGYQEFAVHENWPPHTPGQTYLPATKAEAVVLVVALRARGHGVDAGVMQVNDANWSRLGLTAETVFDRQANICAGMAVMAEAYAIERRVSCRYNTGRPDCGAPSGTNGYPEHIESALRRVRSDLASGSVLPAETAAESRRRAEPHPSTDPFVGHASARELTFIPSFQSAAWSHDGPRPAAPAVPAGPLAVPAQGRGELVSMRSPNR